MDGVPPSVLATGGASTSRTIWSWKRSVKEVRCVSVILNRRESATVIAGLRLLAGDGVRVPNYPRVLVAGLCDETDPEYELRWCGSPTIDSGRESFERRHEVGVLEQSQVVGYGFDGTPVLQLSLQVLQRPQSAREILQLSRIPDGVAPGRRTTPSASRSPADDGFNDRTL